MPFYEYQCTKCGHEEEVLQKISDEPLKICPACGKSGMQKKVSAAAFRLKGGGWYETDFKSGNKKNVAGESANTYKAAGDNKTVDNKSSDNKTPANNSRGTAKESTANTASGKSTLSQSTKGKKVKKAS